MMAKAAAKGRLSAYLHIQLVFDNGDSNDNSTLELWRKGKNSPWILVSSESVRRTQRTLGRKKDYAGKLQRRRA